MRGKGCQDAEKHLPHHKNSTLVSRGCEGKKASRCDKPRYHAPKPRTCEQEDEGKKASRRKKPAPRPEKPTLETGLTGVDFPARFCVVSPVSVVKWSDLDYSPCPPVYQGMTWTHPCSPAHSAFRPLPIFILKPAGRKRSESSIFTRSTTCQQAFLS